MHKGDIKLLARVKTLTNEPTLNSVPQVKDPALQGQGCGTLSCLPKAHAAQLLGGT